jgi:hypothetical protein
MIQRKYRPFLAAAAALLLASCGEYFDLSGLNGASNLLPYNLEPGQFYAQNVATLEYYVVNARKVAEGSKCVIWVETSQNVSGREARAVAKEFDDRIYPMIVNNFSIKNILHPDNTGTYLNSMEYADLLTNGDGKLAILLLDIQDGYKNQSDAYTAGYFSSANFYQKDYDFPYTNGMDMIYIDTWPSTIGSNVSNSTLAHELQHLVNYVNSEYLKRPSMDTWIDEGLATQAEYLYLGGHSATRYNWFMQDPAKTIAHGNNFYVWGNRTNENPAAIIDEYATAYLFFQWLYLQSNKDSGLFSAIALSEYSDYRAVTAVAQAINSRWSSWEDLLKTWLAANFINDPGNEYGYKNDGVLKNIKAKPVQDIEGSSVPLYPGEGVFSSIAGSYSRPNTGSGANIRYAALSSTNASSSLPPGNIIVSGANTLLTFNTNTSENGAIETGYITGLDYIPPSGGARRMVNIPGPLVLDARDIAGRRQMEPAKLLWQTAQDAQN